MADPSPPKTPDPVGAASRPGFFGQWLRDWFTLRKPGPLWESFLLGTACIGLALAVWWLLTRGIPEERIVSPYALPSPAETFERLPELFQEFRLVANTLVTLRRVALGFLLAILVGVPLGILAGCFPRFNSFLAPVVIFGRNIPLAAVVQLLYALIFLSGEQRKVMFIFVACVAFIISDTAQAIMDVADRYVDTAYTLGASRWQTMIKVLVPLAMPTIFTSFRVLFGLAFGYIMLAESMKESDVGGLGYQISTFQKRHLSEHIYLIILIIPLVALGIDLVLFWIQKQLFPHVYGGPGWLQRGVRIVLHGWDDVKRVFFRYEPPAITSAVQPPARGAVPAAAKEPETPKP